MTLPLSREEKFATIVGAYAPTMTDPDEIKDKFYDDLNAVITVVPDADKLIILGDFNTKVGRDRIFWEGVIGIRGVTNCNSKGLLLLQTYVKHSLLITNTVFRLPATSSSPSLTPFGKTLRVHRIGCPGRGSSMSPTS